MMLISKNISDAFFWRSLSAIAFSLFTGFWLCFTFMFGEVNSKKTSFWLKALTFLPLIIYIIIIIKVEPAKTLTRKNYGWIDIFQEPILQGIYIFIFSSFFITGAVKIYLRWRNTCKNRIKKQTKIILALFCVCFVYAMLTDVILPMYGYNVFPSGVIAIAIGMIGVYYAISKHKMMAITPKFLSEYIFNTVNEPIYILSEDFIIQNCNKAAENLTNYKNEEICSISLDKFTINEDIKLKDIMKNGHLEIKEAKFKNKNGESIICEVLGKVIYDEYNDILGIMIMLYDISEKKKISEMNEKVISNLKMKAELNNALVNNEFIIYYQPIIDLTNLKILNSECLIRWRHGGKIIPPMEFISIAKSVGEMVNIDNWVLRTACAQCREWHEKGKVNFTISVNTSYTQLRQSNFISYVDNILKKCSISPQCLNLEITEDEAMEAPEAIIEILKKLKNMGIQISLDDFGTGYSSFSYINKLPIDKIKIDRSLIINLKDDYKNTMIIQAIIKMAHSLQIKVVAEGIETEEQFEILRKLECDYIQGYLIGKPMEAADFECYLVSGGFCR